MKPKDECSIAEVGDVLGITGRRVHQLIVEGAIPKPEKHGKYILETVVQAYVKHLQEKARAPITGDVVGLNAERERLTRAKADIAEMEMDEKRASLIPAKEIEAAWVSALSLLRTRLMSIPNQVAPLCHQEKTQAGVRDLIKQAVRGALDDLAETEIEITPDFEGDGLPPRDAPQRLGSARAAS
jgi:phage terminase Nu1 subunit (DNA packaging protein)